MSRRTKLLLLMLALALIAFGASLWLIKGGP